MCSAPPMAICCTSLRDGDSCELLGDTMEGGTRPRFPALRPPTPWPLLTAPPRAEGPLWPLLDTAAAVMVSAGIPRRVVSRRRVWWCAE